MNEAKILQDFQSAGFGTVCATQQKKLRPGDVAVGTQGVDSMPNWRWKSPWRHRSKKLDLCVPVHGHVRAPKVQKKTDQSIWFDHVLSIWIDLDLFCIQRHRAAWKPVPSRARGTRFVYRFLLNANMCQPLWGRVRLLCYGDPVIGSQAVKVFNLAILTTAANFGRLAFAEVRPQDQNSTWKLPTKTDHN